MRDGCCSGEPALIRDESLGSCPICASSARALVHADLGDDTFRAVPGTWTLWRCAGCTAAYLDPRPDRTSIWEAYQGYYTHSNAPQGQGLSWPGRVRQRMEDGYLHRRYGADKLPPSRLGAALYALLPPYKHMSDVFYRHLPGPGRGRTLLDVGCGNGSFLVQAQACGWDAEGIDPDPEATAEGLRRGVRVRAGDLGLYAGQAQRFDVITLSHVIEHVHDPVAMLADCLRLLRPGGRLWVATPNQDSLGHAYFGRHWRGLETPRHLVLFNERVLRRALMDAGFGQAWRLPSHLREHFAIARASHRMAQGLSPNEPSVRLPLKLLLAVWGMSGRAWLRPARREILYMAACP
jgi:2-polyprenyl-3-methyl-5-hydroxy-6-metoxy-1,4-benzoquinol methylase